MKELITVNDSNFDNHLSDNKAIIVDFWAPTCVPCKLIEPGLKKIASDYQEDVKVLKVNVNESPRTSSKYYVRGLPTLLFIKDGSVKDQMTGNVNPNLIEQTLQKMMQ